MAAFSLAKAAALGDDAFCEWEIYSGLATTVGEAYYPWEATIALRKRWGEIPADWQIEKRRHLVAFHHPQYWRSRLYVGKRAWVISHETGRVLWVDIVDVMANPEALVDLTPEMMGWQLGFADGRRDRGGLDVTMLIPKLGDQKCEALDWPSY
jgi:hypothetical protein